MCHRKDYMIQVQHYTLASHAVHPTHIQNRNTRLRIFPIGTHSFGQHAFHPSKEKSWTKILEMLVIKESNIWTLEMIQSFSSSEHPHSTTIKLQTPQSKFTVPSNLNQWKNQSKAKTK